MRAIYFRWEAADGETWLKWFPISQIKSIHRDKDTPEGKVDQIEVAQWILDKEDIPY